MSLLETLNGDLKAAMKNHDKATLSVVRMLKTGVMNEQIKVGHDLTPDEELAVLSREVKQRKESLAEFKQADRTDLVEQTEDEIEIVEKYMPKQLTESEINEIVRDAIKATGASQMSDFGKVMGMVMPKVKGKADGNVVNATVKKALS